ncbi:hypothetical protein B0T17DRAFT_620556 [Bombardia bombarda]|uniref:Response regulatory domain-containing protein n=1 Tax=Bombardia bombarda TaxID=252184 RepID=A0AA39WCC6_9PEZI|nr:hypothetical protein B0T17DRAFT_620556 [Bombardia bombarda]
MREGQGVSATNLHAMSEVFRTSKDELSERRGGTRSPGATDETATAVASVGLRCLHVMGDLRSKIRARLSRRHSGVPSVASSKSNVSTKSITESRPESQCAANGHSVEKGERAEKNGKSGKGENNAAKVGGQQLRRRGNGEDEDESEDDHHKHEASHNGKKQANQQSQSSTRQATTPATTEARDISRHKTPKQGTVAYTRDSADVSDESDDDTSSDGEEEEDDDDDGDAAALSSSPAPAPHASGPLNLSGAPAVDSASDSACGSDSDSASSRSRSRSPKHDTNSKSGLRPSAPSTGTPAAVTMHTGLRSANDDIAAAGASNSSRGSHPPIITSGGGSGNVNDQQQRPSMAPPASTPTSRLSRINENADSGANSTPSNQSSHHPSTAAAPVPAPAPAVSAAPPVPVAPGSEPEPAVPFAALDSVRRIKLSDPPRSATPAIPTPRPTVSVSVPSPPPPVPSSVPASSTTTNTSPATLRSSSSLSRPTGPPRRQSLLPSRQDTLIRTLLSAVHADDIDLANSESLLPISATMVTRKIWVRRPGGSATLVTINEEDLVDDVREMILRKYANSLGRQFDAPDLTLRIAPREQQRQDRVLGPEEPMARTLDAYFPGGQTVDEALIIDIPPRRTPKESPRLGPPHIQHLNSVYYEEVRPSEGGTDYFGPAAVAHVHAHAPPAVLAGAPVVNGTQHPHTITVLNTGQIPQIPSPGGTRRAYRDRPDRPRLGRQHTSSPTVLTVIGGGGHPTALAVPANHDQLSSSQGPPPAPPLPTPPTPEAPPAQIQRAATPPPPRVASPRPAASSRPKKKKVDHPALPAGMLNGGVPPINVLIVEDNIINLRLLEAFVKRLKVRWQTAMNGREAVTKWRSGGFHLVLMDIQLPVMSGLEATREIRRLERMNSIGVFSSSSHGGDPNASRAAKGNPGETAEEDKLQNMELFKSPVIIVALTASSLQSDRHEALAAGCNDFLTKPVTYVWLERKVMEWGCMQALIDFDGWRKWKDFAPKVDEEAAAKKLKAKLRLKAAPPPTAMVVVETH